MSKNAWAGMCMEDYLIGMEAKITKTISESDVYLFAGITGDFNPVHVNEAAAQKSIFGKRVVHGILLTGLFSAAIGMKLPGHGAVYMEQDTKFLKPVYIGDTITAVVKIIEIINTKKRIIKLSTIAVRDQEKIADGYAVVKIAEKLSTDNKIVL